MSESVEIPRIKVVYIVPPDTPYSVVAEAKKYIEKDFKAKVTMEAKGLVIEFSQYDPSSQDIFNLGVKLGSTLSIPE